MPRTSTRDRTGIVGFGIELIFFILYYVVKSMPLWLEIIGFVVGGLLILYGISGHLMRLWRFISNKQASSASTSSETAAKPPPPDSVGSLPIEKVSGETLRVLQVIRDREEELLADFLPEQVDWWTTSILGSIYRYTWRLDIESRRERNPWFEKKKANDPKLRLLNGELAALKGRLQNTAEVEAAILDEFESRRDTQAFTIYVAVKLEDPESHNQHTLEDELKTKQEGLRQKQVHTTGIISDAIRFMVKPVVLNRGAILEVTNTGRLATFTATGRVMRDIHHQPEVYRLFWDGYGGEAKLGNGATANVLVARQDYVNTQYNLIGLWMFKTTTKGEGHFFCGIRGIDSQEIEPVYIEVTVNPMSSSKNEYKAYYALEQPTITQLIFRQIDSLPEERTT